MPRYDDRRGSTRLYVGHLSSRTRSRDLDSYFSRYGRVLDVDMKRDYAFVEFSDPRDADDARYRMDGRDIDGRRVIVEFARGVPRGSRDVGRGPPPGSGRCFNCGLDGHWARDCEEGDWKNKCYRCGERGHIERHCKNSPKKLRRSPVRRGRSRSRSRSHSRGRSYSRSRSPVVRERSIEREDRSQSPVEKSRTPDETIYQELCRSSRRRERSPSSMSPDIDYDSPIDYSRGGGSMSEANGDRQRSPSPRDDRSPVDDDYDDRPSRIRLDQPD